MRLFVNITETFVRGLRFFEQKTYVQNPFGTLCFGGIGLLRYQEHNYFFRTV